MQCHSVLNLHSLPCSAEGDSSDCKKNSDCGGVDEKYLIFLPSKHCCNTSQLPVWVSLCAMMLVCSLTQFIIYFLVYIQALTFTPSRVCALLTGCWTRTL